MILEVNLTKRFKAKGGPRQGEWVWSTYGNYTYNEEQVLELIMKDINPVEEEGESFELTVSQVTLN